MGEKYFNDKYINEGLIKKLKILSGITILIKKLKKKLIVLSSSDTIAYLNDNHFKNTTDQEITKLKQIRVFCYVT